jgi:NAD(P)-dependent dehydrogenase (short-subunit alcohol dehydrogenase family)
MRRAVVTGGAGAIGAAICDRLRVDHDVLVLDRDQVDLADAAAVRAAAAEVGEADVLVHAAAAFDQMRLAALDLDAWRRVQAVNVEAGLLLAQAFAPGMAERGFGRIVFVTSDTVYGPPSPDLLAYVASKAALVGITRTLALELGADGIAVTAVAPGLTDTPAARDGMPSAAFDAVLARQSLKRTLVPDDVAATVAFLVTDAAQALTGQTLVPDGGLSPR